MRGFQRPFESGSVVWGPDAFHDDDPHLVAQRSRPWLVVNNESLPGRGRHYICCALTSNPRAAPAAIALDAERDWAEGGTPKPSAVDPESIFTMRHDWIQRYSGRLAETRLEDARSRIRQFL